MSLLMKIPFFVRLFRFPTVISRFIVQQYSLPFIRNFELSSQLMQEEMPGRYEAQNKGISLVFQLSSWERTTQLAQLARAKQHAYTAQIQAKRQENERKKNEAFPSVSAVLLCSGGLNFRTAVAKFASRLLHLKKNWIIVILVVYLNSLHSS